MRAKFQSSSYGAIHYAVKDNRFAHPYPITMFMGIIEIFYSKRNNQCARVIGFYRLISLQDCMRKDVLIKVRILKFSKQMWKICCTDPT